ncbi:MAG: SRPBCC family protein [Bryobacteraceae bacterium]|nr:SRPBCC family protein [Bryobacteraceae bacterium]
MSIKTTLPREYFVDPLRFQSEMEALWFGMWVCAGRAPELAHAGDYFLRDVGAERVLVTRGSPARRTSATRATGGFTGEIRGVGHGRSALIVQNYNECLHCPLPHPIECEFHFHPAEMAKKDFVFHDVIDFWDLTNQEDWHIAELSQAGVQSRACTPGPYTAREELLHAFDQWIRRRLG